MAGRRKQYPPKSRKALTPDQVRQVLHYSPEKGEFRWRERRGGTALAGSIAGTLNNTGYRVITVFGCRIIASHLAFFIMLGEWPKDEVDHKNMDTSDDSWMNLREATSSQNKCNRRRRSDSMFRAKGVDFRSDIGRWRAQIRIKGRSIHLGHFQDIDSAAKAYEEAASKYHGEFARIDYQR